MVAKSSLYSASVSSQQLPGASQPAHDTAGTCAYTAFKRARVSSGKIGDAICSRESLTFWAFQGINGTGYNWIAAYTMPQ